MRKKIPALLGMFFLCFMFGCTKLPPGPGISSNANGKKKPPPPAVSNQIEAISISLAGTNQSAVAVGTGGLILYSTSTGSATGAQFPSWSTVANPPTSQNLYSVSFDLDSTGIPFNVLAVGGGGAILENTSAGATSPTTWALGSSDANFTISDPGCADVNAANFAVKLKGASVNSAGGTSQDAVIAGEPFTACGVTKGTLAFSTGPSSDGVFPYSGWTLVDAYGSSTTPLPNETFNGVSYAQDASSTTFVVVVGSNGDIFRGLLPNLASASGWNLDLAGSGTALNSVAVAQNNLQAIAVGNNGTIFTNTTLGSGSWTQVSTGQIPSGYTTDNFTGVFFVPSASSLTAVITGSKGALLLVQNCCDSSSGLFSITNVAPAISGMSTATLTGTWASIGTAAGVSLAGGYSSDGAGFILENDNGGTTTPTGWFQDFPTLDSKTLP